MNTLSRKVRKQAKALGVRYQFLFMQANGSQLRKRAALHDSGKLRPVIDSTFPFDQTPEATAVAAPPRTLQPGHPHHPGRRLLLPAPRAARHRGGRPGRRRRQRRLLGSVAYVAAKHGVVGMTKTAAAEYAAKNIRVNAVGPGFIETPLLKSVDQEAYDGRVGLHPIARLGRPEEVAELTSSG